MHIYVKTEVGIHTSFIRNSYLRKGERVALPGRDFSHFIRNYATDRGIILNYKKMRYNVSNTAHFARLEMSMFSDKTVSVPTNRELEDVEFSPRLALQLQTPIK
jgi:hypothetical protein